MHFFFLNLIKYYEKVKSVRGASWRRKKFSLIFWTIVYFFLQKSYPFQFASFMSMLLSWKCLIKSMVVRLQFLKSKRKNDKTLESCYLNFTNVWTSKKNFNSDRWHDEIVEVFFLHWLHHFHTQKKSISQSKENKIMLNIFWRLGEDVRNTVGDVTILVNNAAVVYVTDIFSRTDQMIRNTFDVNVIAHFRVSNYSYVRF